MSPLLQKDATSIALMVDDMDRHGTGASAANHEIFPVLRCELDGLEQVADRRKAFPL